MKLPARLQTSGLFSSVSGMPITAKGSALAARRYLVCSALHSLRANPYLIVTAQTGRYLIGEISNYVHSSFMEWGGAERCTAVWAHLASQYLVI